MNEKHEIEEGQAFTIDMFHREDAAGVSRLFRAVYGEGYPARIVYNQAELIEAFDKRMNIPAVARTEKGDIISYCALYRSAPNPNLYEMGRALVLPSYRGGSILLKLTLLLYEAAARQNIDAVFLEAVCNHAYSQKIAADAFGGDSETAIEIDLMPKEAFVTEKSASGRVASMLMFAIFKYNSQTIYIPKKYKDQVDYILSAKNIRLNNKNTYLESSGDAPSDLKTAFSTEVYDFAKVARITFSETGADFKRVFEKIEEEILLQHMIVIQVWLKLTTPWIGSVVDILRSKGYFLGGVLPKWFGDDGLLMQKVIGRPSWDGINLYSERAANILNFIKADWEEVGIAFNHQQS
jgi:hypothetical protein